MSVDGVAGSGPFRGLIPYDEASSTVFFGRAADTQRLLDQLRREGNRVTAFTGESGVGKTSLLRAGLIPLLAKQGVVGLYIGNYDAIDQDLWQSASRARAEPPSAAETSADYVARLSRSSQSGAVVILDHVETIVADSADPAIVAGLGAVIAAAATAAGPRLRFLFSVETTAFCQLDRLHDACGLSPQAGTWTTLGRMPEADVAQVLEQTALHTGTFFEEGLAQTIAADLCRHGPCLPLDLQIVVRAVLDLRLTSLRRYERSGGRDMLLHLFFERLTAEAGGGKARRILGDLAAAGDTTAEEIAARTQMARTTIDRALASFVARGVLRKRDSDRSEKYKLVHPAIADRVATFTAGERATAARVRRALGRRILAEERLPLREIYAVRRHLGGALTKGEEATVTRSIRRSAFQAALGAMAAVALVVAIFIDLRTSYTLVFEPATDPPNARVVVRLGRPSLAFMNFLPSRPALGSMVADTGFSAAGVASDLSSRIASGRASGALERDRHTALPGWMRAVVDGLRPVPRGVTLVLLGDANGVVSLKQAFADTQSRRETLEALAVIGGGRAGEDEILAAALADRSPEVRRRGVEVAASIDRRLGTGSHASTLRSALGDASFEVRDAVLRECDTLVPAEAASVLAVALVDKDGSFRRLAEREVLALAKRSAAAAAEATRPALKNPDAAIRRNGLALLETIAARAPTDTAAVLTAVVTDAEAGDEARVAALLYLRRTGVPMAPLKAFLDQAVSPEASPRLRAAALPLYARLLDPAKAEELAIAEGRLVPPNRAASAAVWGTIAIKQPELATKALKGFLYDPAPEARIEAARSFGYLKHEGVVLIQKALTDPNMDVQRAAIESAVQLSSTQALAVAEVLGKAFLNVRPATRRLITEALGRIGHDRPAAVLAPLARILKTGDGPSRAGATTNFCVIARKNAAAAAPYLRIASRDDSREVRTAAAACLGDLGEDDPKGAARIAGELAGAGEAAVRAAAATSLGHLAAKAHEAVLPAVLKLLQDGDRTVRLAAVESLGAYAASAPQKPQGKRTDDIDRALAALYAQGDTDERKAAIKVAASSHLTNLLRHAGADPDEDIRIAAVVAAASIGPAGIEILQAAADDRSAPVRAEAVRRLAGTSGEGARQVVPVFASMLRSGDPASRRAGALALGELTGAGEMATRLLGEILHERGEAARAAAAQALGRIAERDPEHATPLLEQALQDPAYDVRSTAIKGLGAVWSKKRSASEIGKVLETSEADSAQRFVALEALVLQAQEGSQKSQAVAALSRIAESGPPLARLAAQVGRAFLRTDRAAMYAFLEKLLGG